MEESISPFRIANAIMQDSDFPGHYLLVKGKKDLKVYRKFCLTENVKLRPTFGKYKLRQAYEILTERGFHSKIGIRDADFLRIDGNPKFDANYSDKIFATDQHDSEIMIIESAAFDNLLFTLIEEGKLEKFELDKGAKIRDIVYSLAWHIGCLRLAHKRFDLGLSFRPDRADGPKLKISRFICDKKCEFLGDDIMINTVFEYSKNRGKVVMDRATLLKHLLEIKAENHRMTDLVNGHDVAEIIAIIAKNGLATSNKLLKDSEGVEDMLALSFNLGDFSKTGLYKQIKAWENTSMVSVLQNA